MNILICGTFDISNSTRHEVKVADCLKELGHKIILYDYRENLRYYGESVCITGLFIKARATQTDLIVIFSGKGLSAKLVEFHNSTNIPIHIWYHDYNLNSPKQQWLVKLALISNKVFLTTGDLNFRNLYPNKYNEPAIFLPTTAYDKVFFPVEISEREYDISFMGTPHTHRIELMRYLVGNGVRLVIHSYPSMDFKWPEDLKPYVTVAKFNTLANIVLNSSKLILNPNVTQDVPLCFSDRYFMPLATKTCGINEYFEGYEELFKHDVHMSIWKTYDECLHQIKQLLTDKEKRIKIAQNGYDLYMEKYRLQDMVKKLL
jgi:spore maturation protein CgeB